jgi:hypothetical protein
VRTLIVQRRTLWSRWLEGWEHVVPAALTRAIVGPSTRYVAGTVRPRTTQWLRPLEIVVPHDLILKRRLRIPREGVPDLPHAIDLVVSRETPFSSDELLIHAQEEEVTEAGQALSFVLRMVPTATLRKALEAARFPLRLVSGLTLEEAGRILPHVNLVEALRPSLRLRWLAFAIPIAVIVAMTTILSQQYLAERSSNLATMERYLSSRVARLEALSREIENEKARGNGRQAVMDLLAATGSAYDSLRWLRAALPEAMQVALIELAHGEMRVAVRSADILADVERLNASGRGWSVSIQGALTTDLSTGSELATLLCTRELR